MDCERGWEDPSWGWSRAHLTSDPCSFLSALTDLELLPSLLKSTQHLAFSTGVHAHTLSVHTQ